MASEAGENRLETQKEIHNHCFTYPQGQVSIMPQLLTLMATVASLLPWPWSWFGASFLCIDYTVSEYTSDSECFPLYLFHEAYWSNQDYDGSTVSTQGWGAAIQAAAVFAILAPALGFVAFSLLVTATCFELSACKILTIIVVQGEAAIFSILTLIAGLADLCKLVDDSSSCSRDGMHIASGAGFEIFASILYFAALSFTSVWYLQLWRRGATPKEETRSLVEKAPQTKSVTTTTVLTPNGEERIEREYIDETGQVVKEVTIARSEQPRHSVERELYPTSVTTSTPSDDQFVEREDIDETGQGHSSNLHNHRHHRHHHRHPQPAPQESF